MTNNIVSDKRLPFHSSLDNMARLQSLSWGLASSPDRKLFFITIL